MKLSIVIPCYNEELVLPMLFQRVAAAAAAWGIDYEVICVDDGSRDRTWQILLAQHERDGRWRCLSLARNFGHQSAVSAGLYHANGDAVAIMDADLQDPPESIARLLEQWRAGYQVVYAVRARRADPAMKSFLAWGFYRVLARLVPFQVPIDSGDFCLLDRKVVDVLNFIPERARYLRGLRAWAGFRQIGVEFQREQRAAGSPKYTWRKSMRLALDGVFSFSSAPLRIASVAGWWISSIALLGVAFIFIQRVFDDWFASIGMAPAPGFATIVISILFLGGVQLICLGILGEYLGRIYDEVKGRPRWIINEAIGFEQRPAAPKNPLVAP